MQVAACNVQGELHEALCAQGLARATWVSNPAPCKKESAVVHLHLRWCICICGGASAVVHHASIHQDHLTFFLSAKFRCVQTHSSNTSFGSKRSHAHGRMMAREVRKEDKGKEQRQNRVANKGQGAVIYCCVCPGSKTARPCRGAFDPSLILSYLRWCICTCGGASAVVHLHLKMMHLHLKMMHLHLIIRCRCTISYHILKKKEKWRQSFAFRRIKSQSPSTLHFFLSQSVSHESHSHGHEGQSPGHEGQSPKVSGCHHRHCLPFRTVSNGFERFRTFGCRHRGIPPPPADFEWPLPGTIYKTNKYPISGASWEFARVTHITPTGRIACIKLETTRVRVEKTGLSSVLSSVVQPGEPTRRKVYITPSVKSRDGTVRTHDVSLYSSSGRHNIRSWEISSGTSINWVDA